MKFAILKVILWPTDRTKRVRVIEFEDGKINVITGQSMSGKSTITWLIDYCLGSDKCSIPVGVRQKADWFGLHLRGPNGDMLIARQSPGGHQTSSEVFLREGVIDQIVERPQKTTNVQALKNRLNEMGGLSTISLATRPDQAFADRPSFRDLVAFNFLPQHIVANPYTLFYKADTSDHREKLKNVFPLALGAIRSEDLVARRQLEELERRAEHIRRELTQRRAARDAWLGEIEAFFTKAVELGLSDDDRPLPNVTWGVEDYRLRLAQLLARLEANPIPEPAPGATERGLSILGSVASEEDALAEGIGTHRRRLFRVRQASASIRAFETELAREEDRLTGVGWLAKRIGDVHVCPICHAETTEGAQSLARLRALVDEASRLSASVRATPPVLDREIVELESAIHRDEESLVKARRKRRVLEDRNAEDAGKRQKLLEVYRFAGRLEQAFRNLEAASDDGHLGEKLASLQQEIASLRGVHDSSVRKRREEAALTQVAASISRYAKILELERKDDAISLDLKDLTLGFTSPLQGRTDYLWEIGSAKNWMGYHIATLLALHQHFLSLPVSPIGTFLVIDQPSQAFFPEAWPSIDKDPDPRTAEEIARRSDDLRGVRNVFCALAEMLRMERGHFQVIVTEHAGAITWSGIERIHLVGNWRRGFDEFLMPEDWM